MIHLVLDTNEYVSALIQPAGLPAKIIKAWRSRRIQLVTSPLIQEEIERVLQYSRIKKKYHLTDKDIRDFLKLIAVETLTTEDKIKVDVVEEDPSDNKFLACALEGKADYIVSSDRHLLQLESYRGMKILKPRAFWQELKGKLKK